MEKSHLKEDTILEELSVTLGEYKNSKKPKKIYSEDLIRDKLFAKKLEEENECLLGGTKKIDLYLFEMSKITLLAEKEYNMYFQSYIPLSKRIEIVERLKNEKISASSSCARKENTKFSFINSILDIIQFVIHYK